MRLTFLALTISAVLATCCSKAPESPAPAVPFQIPQRPFETITREGSRGDYEADRTESYWNGIISDFEYEVKKNAYIADSEITGAMCQAAMLTVQQKWQKKNLDGVDERAIEAFDAFFSLRDDMDLFDASIAAENGAGPVIRGFAAGLRAVAKKSAAPAVENGIEEINRAASNAAERRSIARRIDATFDTMEGVRQHLASRYGGDFKKL